MLTFERVSNFLFKPIDSASLCLFRIVFGALAFFDVLNNYIYYHLTIDDYSVDKFHFRYIGFEWVKPFPEPLMTFFFIGVMIVALFVLIGLRYRIAATFLAFGYTYLFLLEKSHYLNHGYLFCWLCWLMIFLPAHSDYSLDARLQICNRRTELFLYQLLPLPLLMGVVYFFGGLAKINPDWLQGLPLRLWLENKAEYPLIGEFLASEFTVWFMAYGGLIFDLSVSFLLLWRRTRVLAFLAALFFHSMNAVVFNIGIFPYLSLALTALFFPPSFPRKLFGHVSSQQSAKLISAKLSPSRRRMVLIGITLLIAIHTILPLRHFWFPGNVAWNEFGHRYAWRMMLRSKQGFGSFTEEDRKTGESRIIYPKKHLSSKQARKMYTHPDMILQFAHFIAEQNRNKGREVSVYATIMVSLNGRDAKLFTDPTVDLSQENWSYFSPPKWIKKELELNTMLD